MFKHTQTICRLMFSRKFCEISKNPFHSKIKEKKRKKKDSAKNQTLNEGEEMDVKQREESCASYEFPFKAYTFSDLRGVTKMYPAKKLLFTGIQKKKTIQESF